MLTHLSLFTGIGGLDIAAEMAGFETVGQCEWADFPTKVLEKHWPDVTRWKNVRELTAESFREQTGLETVTCISGGFPCQPHSLAGERKASSDERDLWPEFRRIIGEIRPRWVVAENVRGLLSSEHGRFFRGILRDFADLGFDVGWATYPAAAVGAVHRRERMAIVAHANGGLGKRVFCGYGKTCDTRDFKPKEWREIRIIAELDTGISRIIQAGKEKSCQSLVTRSDDGFSSALDRCRCLGNAVYPPQFYPIFEAIARIEPTA